MSTQTLTVVLVHRNDIERAQIRQALEAIAGVQIGGERNDLRAGMALAHQVRPDILLLELSGSGDDTLTAASQYRLENPDVAIFVSSDALSPETLMRAMRAGASEVLRRPLDRPALTEAVERVAQLKARKMGGGLQRTVVTVFSNKGGVGVSTIATNLALSLRRQTRREVALADLDYQSGDVASILGLATARSIGDLIGKDRFDSAVVQGVMAKHASGVMVLPQPEQIDQADGLTAHQAGSILETLGSTYEIVVVDAPHLINDIALEIFDRSSQILLVAELSLPSVRAARRSLDIFGKLNYLAVPDRVRVLINRRTDKGAILPAQVEEALGVPISFSVTNDYAAVSESINLGRPLCAGEPSSRAGRDLDAIALQLVPVEGNQPVEVAPPRRKGLKLFGRG
jgi:pilus assembly protein CpaE